MSRRLLGGRGCWWWRVLVIALAVTGFAVFAPLADGSTLTWSEPLALDAGNGFDSITCLTTTECVTGDFDGHQLTFDPAGDGIISGPTPALDPSRVLEIACAPFSTQCTAVDDVGRATTFNATTGAVVAGPTSIDGTEGLDAISCLTTTECVAVDGDGARITFNPSNESVTSSHTVDSGNSLYAVVCSRPPSASRPTTPNTPCPSTRAPPAGQLGRT
jgi:hypothetical protein